MACRLINAKPLAEPLLVHCQLDPWEQISMKFEWNTKLSFMKMYLKMSFVEMVAILSRGRWFNSGSVNNYLKEKQQQQRHLLHINNSSGCTRNRVLAKWQLGNNCMIYSYELVGWAKKFPTWTDCWQHDIFLFITQLAVKVAVNILNIQWVRNHFLCAHVMIMCCIINCDIITIITQSIVTPTTEITEKKNNNNNKKTKWGTVSMCE